MKNVIRLATISSLMALMMFMFAPVAEAAKYTGKAFSFTYPATLKKEKSQCTSSGCFVTLVPPSAKSKQLQKQSSQYSVRVSKLGTDADPLTQDEQAALDKGDWSGFIKALTQEVKESLNPTSVSSKSYSIPKHTATLVVLKFRQGPASVVANSVIVTKDKKTAYLVQEVWVYTNSKYAKNPFGADFTAIAKSFRVK